MNQQHLSEEMIQELAAAGHIPEVQQQHLDQCPRCQASLAASRALFVQLQQLPEQSFSFDLEAAVMKHIPVVYEKKTDQWWFWLPLLIILPVSGLLGYLFHDQLNDLFSGVPLLEIGVAVTAGTAILVLGGYDLIRSYQRRMQYLDKGL